MTREEINSELAEAKTMARKLEVMAKAYDLTKPLPALTARMIDSQLLNIAHILKLPKK